MFTLQVRASKEPRDEHKTSLLRPLQTWTGRQGTSIEKISNLRENVVKRKWEMLIPYLLPFCCTVPYCSF